MMKYQQLEPYKNAVEQMEILAEGSALLKKKYWEEKNKIRKQVQKSISNISEAYRPGLRRSIKNDQITRHVDNAEINFVTMWHRLLMRTLAPLFYTTYRVTKI